MQQGHRLGTLQDVSAWDLISKSAYYLVQEFNSLFLYRVPILDGLFTNITTAVLVVAILLLAIWLVARRTRYAGEGKFILMMFCLILGQNALLLLTTVDWYKNVSWSSVTSNLTTQHTANQFMAVIAIFLCVLWIYVRYRRDNGLSFSRLNRVILQFAAVAGICLFVNMHPNAKTGWGWDANPTISRADWQTYVPMLDSDAYSIRLESSGWYYMKNSSMASREISKCAAESLSDMEELREKRAFVFYTRKYGQTNQLLDRYYYMDIYDLDGNLMLRVRQMNQDAERPYIAFYVKEGVTGIGRVEFSYEDGSRAFVDESIEIGYR